MRQEPSAIKTAKHANDSDRTKAYSHTMPECYYTRTRMANTAHKKPALQNRKHLVQCPNRHIFVTWNKAFDP